MEQLPLLRGLTASNRAIYEQMLQPKTCFYEKGEVIYLSKNQVGFVMKGIIKITRTDEDGKYSIAEILNEGSLISNVYSLFMDEGFYEIEAGKNCCVCFVNYNDVININNNTIINNFIQSIAERSKNQGQRIHVLSQRTIREKLLTYFEIVRGNRKEKTFVIPMAYSSLAEFLCVDRSAMMRELNNMREDNLIRVRGKNIMIVG